MRSIIHFRLNSFCAKLEQLRKPELVGKPVLVTHKSGRGEFVVSASLECDGSTSLFSRRLDAVHVGKSDVEPSHSKDITARHALRYCPTAIVVPADWDFYRETSEAVMDILSAYSPRLEPDSLDKAYMDVTGCTKLFGSPKRIAQEVQRRVMDEIGVPVSIGIARNKLAACAASSACEPGGYMAVRPGTEAEFVSKLPVGSLNGVGPKIEKRLQVLGVRTTGDLAAIPERLLIRQFGALGSRLRTQSQGIDYAPVAALYPLPIIIIEHTFGYDDADPSEPGIVEAYLLWMCERLAMQMRKRDQQAGSLKLLLEYGSASESRFYAFKTPVSSAHDIYIGARRLWSAMARHRFDPGGSTPSGSPPCQATAQQSDVEPSHSKAVCGLKLTLSDLESGSGIQLSLIGDAERRMRLDAVLETIRSRFGDRAIAYLRTQMAQI